VVWNDTKRELKIDLPIDPEYKGHIAIMPKDILGFQAEATFLSHFLGNTYSGNLSHVVGVVSDVIPKGDEPSSDFVIRTFSINALPLRILEQTGESIIRRPWDAGIILAAALTRRSFSSLPPPLYNMIKPLFLHGRPMTVLELGTGVGVLGISISAAYKNAKVIVSDLPDAESLVVRNIPQNSRIFPHVEKNTSWRPLDWESRPFPTWTETETFDFIVMSDVTYHSSMFVPLAETLEHLLRNGAKGAKVVCCAKRRHEDEEEFWRMVKERGFVLETRITLAINLQGKIRYCDEGEEPCDEEKTEETEEAADEADEANEADEADETKESEGNEEMEKGEEEGERSDEKFIDFVVMSLE
jgi:hypothetical protein